MPEFLRKNNEETSFDLDLVNGWFWDMHIYSVKIKQFKIDKRSIRAVPSENGKPNSIVFEIENADLEGQPIGGFQFANFQMFNLTQVKFTGLRMKMELSVIQDDNVTQYWQVAGSSEIDFADLQFQTDSQIINTAFDLFHGMIVRYLRSYENGYGQAFQKTLNEFNLLLRARSNFYIPWPDREIHRFNNTFTQPPVIDAQNQ